MLTLREAIRSNPLPEFIEQEEARGLGAIDFGDLDQALRAVITPHRSEGQTT